MTFLALKELKRFKVIDSDEDVRFSAVEMLSSGFPMPSVNNFKSFADIRDRISADQVSNLMLLVFFQKTRCSSSVMSWLRPGINLCIRTVE